jgi:hypothetical protein
MKLEHEGTPAWFEGIRASLAVVRWRQSTLTAMQAPAYTAALVEVETLLLAMIERGSSKRTTPLD